MLQTVGSLGHFVVLPWCDLTLIACNSATAILMNVYISWRYLGEKFVPKYDLPAVIFVGIGAFIIVYMSNKEQQTFTVDRILRLMTTWGSTLYFVTTILLTLLVHWLVPVILKKLRAFEKDCELWEAHNAPNRVLPAKNRATDDAT